MQKWNSIIKTKKRKENLLYASPLGIPIHCGYVHKKGGSKMNPYLKRWFTLHHNQLLYFKPSKRNRARGIIFLYGDVEVEIEDKKKRLFSLKGKNLKRKFMLMVKGDNQEFEKWIEILQKQIKILKEEEEQIKKEQEEAKSIFFGKKISKEEQFPTFLDAIYRIILKNGKNKVGIFRKNANKQEINRLIKEIEDMGKNNPSEKVEFYEKKLENESVYLLADVIKFYLKSIPNRLFPINEFEKYALFSETIKDDDDDDDEIEEPIARTKHARSNSFGAKTKNEETDLEDSELKPALSMYESEKIDGKKKQFKKLIYQTMKNRPVTLKLIKRLFFFLHKLEKFKPQTQMTADNLAICITPNIMKPKVVTLEYSKTLQKLIILVKWMIKHFHFFFDHSENIEQIENISIEKHEAERIRKIQQMRKQKAREKKKMEHKKKMAAKRVKFFKNALPISPMLMKIRRTNRAKRKNSLIQTQFQFDKEIVKEWHNLKISMDENQWFTMVYKDRYSIVLSKEKGSTFESLSNFLKSQNDIVYIAYKIVLKKNQMIEEVEQEEEKGMKNEKGEDSFINEEEQENEMVMMLITYFPDNLSQHDKSKLFFHMSKVMIKLQNGLSCSFQNSNVDDLPTEIKNHMETKFDNFASFNYSL